MWGRDESWVPTRNHVHEEPVPTLKNSSVDMAEKRANANIEGVILRELSYTH